MPSSCSTRRRPGLERELVEKDLQCGRVVADAESSDPLAKYGPLLDLQCGRVVADAESCAPVVNAAR